MADSLDLTEHRLADAPVLPGTHALALTLTCAWVPGVDCVTFVHAFACTQWPQSTRRPLRS